jgi:hypothetical protein
VAHTVRAWKRLCGKLSGYPSPVALVLADNALEDPRQFAPPNPV